MSSALENARIAVEQDLAWRDTEAHEASLFLLKCVRLARDLPTCEMLLRDEKVPRSCLDQVWVKAYGL